MKTKKLLASAVAALSATALLNAPVASADPIRLPFHEKDCSKLAVTLPGGGQSLEAVPGIISPSVSRDVAQNLIKRGWTVNIASYQATPFLNTTYEQSVQRATDTAYAAINKTIAGCKNPKISLVGYSESADVLARIASDIGHGRSQINASNIGRIALFSNPHHGTAGGRVIGAGGPGVLGRIDEGYGSLSGRVAEICAGGDAICDGAVSSAAQPLKETVLGFTAMHNPSVELSQMAGFNPLNTPALAVGMARHVYGYGPAQVGAATNFIAN